MATYQRGDSARNGWTLEALAARSRRGDWEGEGKERRGEREEREGRANPLTTFTGDFLQIAFPLSHCT